MSTPLLQSRSHDPELMDEPDVSPEVLREALRQLAFINVALGGISTTMAGVKSLLPPGTKSFSFLDVGCGSGDTLLAVAQFAKRHGQTVDLHGVELSGVSVEMARNRLQNACATTARIETTNLFDLPPTPQYDIVHAALVLHHMSDDEEAVRALAKMASLARIGVVINDLHRHPFAHDSIRILTRVLSRNPLIRHDAPLSVRRSFTREELAQLAERAGLRNVTIQWHWAFRWLLVARSQHA